MSLTNERTPVRVQILYLKMTSGKNCLHYQIPAVLRLSAKRKSAYVCLDPDVELSIFPRQRPFLINMNIGVDFSTRTLCVYAHFINEALGLSSGQFKSSQSPLLPHSKRRNGTELQIIPAVPPLPPPSHTCL